MGGPNQHLYLAAELLVARPSRASVPNAGTTKSKPNGLKTRNGSQWTIFSFFFTLAYGLRVLSAVLGGYK